MNAVRLTFGLLTIASLALLGPAWLALLVTLAVVASLANSSAQADQPDGEQNAHAVDDAIRNARRRIVWRDQLR